MDIRTICHNYRVVTLSTFYPNVSGIKIPSLKSIGESKHAYIDQLKLKINQLNYVVVTTAKGIISESLKSVGQF